MLITSQMLPTARTVQYYYFSTSENSCFHLCFKSRTFLPTVGSRKLKPAPNVSQRYVTRSQLRTLCERLFQKPQMHVSAEPRPVIKLAMSGTDAARRLLVFPFNHYVLFFF